MPTSSIVFLAAHPIELAAVQLGEECRAIELAIRGARFRDDIDLRSRWAARPDDLLQVLNDDDPSILHFSGHGSGRTGIYFQDDTGRAQLVATDALVGVIRAAGARVSLVVLNACYSECQADALVECVPCVIGISGAIPDLAAITYASAFYRAIASRTSVATAHRQGLAALALQPTGGGRRDAVQPNDEPHAAVPHLLTRPGVNADEIYALHRAAARRPTAVWRTVLVVVLVIGPGLIATARWTPIRPNARAPASDAANYIGAVTVDAHVDAAASDSAIASDGDSHPFHKTTTTPAGPIPTDAPLDPVQQVLADVDNRTCASLDAAPSTEAGDDGNLATVICRCAGRDVRSGPIVIARRSGTIVLSRSARERLREAARSLSCEGAR